MPPDEAAAAKSRLLDFSSTNPLPRLGSSLERSFLADKKGRLKPAFFLAFAWPGLESDLKRRGEGRAALEGIDASCSWKIGIPPAQIQ
jgi:hypothetical protein